MATVQTVALEVMLDGARLNDQYVNSLVSIDVDRSFCTVSRAKLRFYDRGFAVSSSGAFEIGKTVTVKDRSTTLFEGEVTSVYLEQDAAFTPELLVVADDKTHRLARSTLTTTYAAMTYSDVIEKLAKEAGLGVAVAATTLKHDYLVQGGSQLSYIDELCARTGQVWLCTYPAKLKVAKPDDFDKKSVAFKLGEDGIGFSVRASARNVDSVRVTGWDEAQSRAIVGTSTAPKPATSAFASGTTKKTFPEAKVARSDLTPHSKQEADELAASLNREVQSHAVEARGRCYGNADITPGATVTVTGAGPASGPYFVTEVHHRYDTDGYLTDFVAGPLRGGGLVDLLSTPRTEPGFGLQNVISAVVTDIKDPKKLGRVKVKFPSISDELQSEWARVVVLGGGADRGAMFLPEPNDEVLVAFDRGDTRSPIVLGGLHSAQNALPGTNPVDNGNNKVRRVKSRAAHVLEFGDEAGKEYVLVQHGGKQHSVKLTNEGIEITAVGSGSITLKTAGASITMTDSGNITLKGNGAIKTEASQGVELKGMTVKAEASTSLDVKGAKVGIKADGIAQVEASGPLTIKGAIVKVN